LRSRREGARRAPSARPAANDGDALLSDRENARERGERDRTRERESARANERVCVSESERARARARASEREREREHVVMENELSAAH
jgi:hypothetical protein